MDGSSEDTNTDAEDQDAGDVDAEDQGAEDVDSEGENP